MFDLVDPPSLYLVLHNHSDSGLTGLELIDPTLRVPNKTSGFLKSHLSLQCQNPTFISLISAL